jgi:hypothetical protein
MIARHQALPVGVFATQVILCRLDHGTGLSLFCTYEPQRIGTVTGWGRRIQGRGPPARYAANDIWSEILRGRECAAT